MFVLTKFTAVDRGIAAVLAVALVCWAVGAHYTAQAAGLTTITDTLSTSQPGTAANHTIEFDLPTGSAGIDADDVIRVTFPAGFTGVASIVDDDVDLALNTTDEAVGTDWTASTTGQIFELVSVAGTVSAGDTLEIEIGTNATFDATTGTNQITNNAATGSYELLIEIVDEGTTVQDSGSTILAIIEQVTVTADVDPIFNFTVTGTTTGTTIDTEATTVTTTATEIPFGTLDALGTAAVAAQELSVVTNAVAGFAVTVFTNQQLTASNNADIDSFSDGTDVSTPTAWDNPTGTIGSEETYGHWGFRTSDGSLDVGATFADGQYEHVPVFTTGPREIFYHNGPTDGLNSSIDEGFTQVMYKAEIMSFQEAADDYTALLTYVATPVF
ncbi:MAG TPA: hypothetical protein VKP88_08460 [Candidatus Paceibacterota bacterium]|nr:hypothetical protein [Candidatus Paceibacterota bacterium]